MPLILKEVLSKKTSYRASTSKKKLMQTNWTKKKIHPLKNFYPPPVISNGPLLIRQALIVAVH